MWFKTVDGSYYNIILGTQVAVTESRGGGDFRIMVINTNAVPVVCLQSGYLNKDDAQDALDAIMDDQEVIKLDAPDYEDEVESDVDTDVDVEVSTEDAEPVAYESMTNDQLRTELASRELSTTGRHNELIARLNDDDAARELA